MKKAFLLIVVSALLVALGFAQTPAASSNTDQTNIRGCLGGSDDNYTVAEDNTGQIFKITTSSVDLKPHLGHDIKLVGHKASGAVSSGIADNSLAVTELSMISEHCAGAAATPIATVSTSPDTVITPAAPAAASAAAPVSAPSETATTPAPEPAAPAAAPDATVNTPAADTAAPNASVDAPAATVNPRAATVNPPAATVSPSSEAVSATAAATAHPARPSAHPRKQLATPAAAAATPAATVSPHTADAAAPAAPASTPSETDSTPAAAPTTPTVTHKGGSLWLFIPFVVLLIALGTLVPLLNRWRKRRLLEQTSAQNLSLTRNPSSDPGKSDTPVVVHKAA
jgi:hypothetical protein